MWRGWSGNQTLPGRSKTLFQLWDQADQKTYSLFYQIMLLASNFISVGMPYISTFLPSLKKAFWQQDVGEELPSDIPLNLNLTERYPRGRGRPLESFRGFDVACE
jgi:hypothetical protein